jgi:hypothetical protein
VKHLSTLVIFAFVLMSWISPSVPAQVRKPISPQPLPSPTPQQLPKIVNPRIINHGTPLSVVPNLDDWLAKHTKVRDAIIWERPNGTLPYVGWSDQQKKLLQEAFNAVWNNSEPAGGSPFANITNPPDNDYPETVLSEPDAWTLYKESLAETFVAEIGKRVPWTITTYSSEQLAILLDSREFFKWKELYVGQQSGSGALVAGYYLDTSYTGWVLPARPGFIWKFIKDNKLIGSDRVSTIGNLITWCGNLIHFEGGWDTKNMENHWQYRGFTPASRMINGTVRTDKPQNGLNHYTAGCTGTSGFLRAVLRGLNIPALYKTVAGHSLPYFPTEGKYLSHGDDPYPLKYHPEISGVALLIDQAKFDSWFGPNVPDAEKKQNIGRRMKELLGN